MESVKITKYNPYLQDGPSDDSVFIIQTYMEKIIPEKEQILFISDNLSARLNKEICSDPTGKETSPKCDWCESYLWKPTGLTIYSSTTCNVCKSVFCNDGCRDYGNCNKLTNRQGCNLCVSKYECWDCEKVGCTYSNQLCCRCDKVTDSCLACKI